MSEQAGQEPGNTELEEGTAESGTPAKLTYEQMEAELARVRREAGNRRNKEKDLNDKLQKFTEWEKSQMTELERAKAEKADLEKEMRELVQEKHQSIAGAKAGLDPELYDRIRGDSAEEMLEDAKRLAGRYPSTGTAKSPAGDLFASERGKPVGSTSEESESEWFRKQFSH